MVGSSSLQAETCEVLWVWGCSPAQPSPDRPSLPFTFDLFFPAWLRPRLLPYFGLFRLLCLFTVAFLARNPPRKNQDSGLRLDLGFRATKVSPAVTGGCDLAEQERTQPRVQELCQAGDEGPANLTQWAAWGHLWGTEP